MKQKPGFTMVEMLMVMGIMGVLVVILSEVFGSILTMKLRSQATTALAQDSRYVIARLTYDVARAQDITSSTGNTLTLVISGTTHTYSLQGSTLVVSVGGGAPIALTGIHTQVNGLTFTRFADLGGQKSVRVSLAIAPTIITPGGVAGERLVTTTIATR